MTDFLLMVCGAVFAMVISGIVNYKKSAWVGLSEKEMYKLWLTVDEETDRMAFGKAVEAKLKEKNT